jgi:Ca2+-transporting ATPase
MQAFLGDTGNPIKLTSTPVFITGVDFVIIPWYTTFMKKEFHTLGISQTLQELDVSPTVGLSETAAADRLAQYGANKLAEGKKKSVISRVLAQFKDFLILILIAAAIISVVFGDGLKDAVIILAILVINMIISITQENKADNALRELKDMSSPGTKVRRGSAVMKIDSTQVVPGDVVILEAGDYVCADLRIIEAINLKIDESSLTGESVPVEKNAEAVLAANTNLGDRSNCACMGTVVTYGRGIGVVYATGKNTEMGKIAQLLSETDEAVTPLQDKLNAMAKTLGVICIITCAIVFAVGFLYDFLDIGEQRGIIDMFMISVSLAVAAVPEGVAIVATVILAIGVQKMVRSNVIVKKLRAVETLGSTTVICSDKTGTMTQNKMTVVEVFTDDEKALCLCAALCNDAIRCENGKFLGDPTETAIAEYADIDTSAYTRTHEIPFDSAVKFMQVTVNGSDYLKGSVEAVLARCGAENPQAIKKAEEMASRALRVLAFSVDKKFVGLMGMLDPPREEVKSAVAKCRSAGINVKMLTGDHKITALAIAGELGIDSQDVYARVSPEDKVKIVTDLKAAGHIVAMTGDGVNDAPSLKKADIGIAMGITGTDVSKEAADMILTDDNFVSIVKAVEQGRTIYGNIRKVTGYLLGCNIGEILIILIAIILGLPVPLVATQLLFVNLLTDAFPAFALGLEGRERGVMKKPPRDPAEPIINKSMRATVAIRAVFLTLGTLGSFVYGLFVLSDYAVAVTMSFFTLVAGELLLAFPARCEGAVLFRRGLFKNKFMNISVGISLLILLATIYLPLLNEIFTTVPLNLPQFGICSAFIGAAVIGCELAKAIQTKH